MLTNGEEIVQLQEFCLRRDEFTFVVAARVSFREFAPGGVGRGQNATAYCATAFCARNAAHLFFVASAILLRPAVLSLRFLAGVPSALAGASLALCYSAQRFFWASAILLRAASDIPRLAAQADFDAAPVDGPSWLLISATA
jgi:hypothetical protein